MNAPPTSTVVVLTRNGGPEVEALFAAVRGQALSPPPQLLVIDSGSTDGTAEAARRWADRVVHIAPADFDHGATRARAVHEATTELVAFVVQDALPADEHWLARLVDALGDEGVAGAYSRQLPREGGDFFVVDRQLRSPIAEPRRRRQTIGDRLAFERQPPLTRLATCTFDNVASCVRRRVALGIGFRRSRFGEDVDWARRVLAAGYALIYEPASRVLHSHDRGSWYELRRAYLCHQLLARAFGLRLVPRGTDVLSGAAREYRRLLSAIGGRADLSRSRRAELRGKALPFVFSQAVGAWLGALSVKGLADRRRSARLLDHLLAGGV